MPPVGLSFCSDDSHHDNNMTTENETVRRSALSNLRTLGLMPIPMNLWESSVAQWLDDRH
jgi:hypothetical protein